MQILWNVQTYLRTTAIFSNYGLQWNHSVYCFILAYRSNLRFRVVAKNLTKNDLLENKMFTSLEDSFGNYGKLQYEVKCVRINVTVYELE